MDMFNSFLRVAPDGSSNREYKEKLFAGLEILKDKEFTDKYLGQFHVISFSLKSVFGKDYVKNHESDPSISCEVDPSFVPKNQDHLEMKN